MVFFKAIAIAVFFASVYTFYWHNVEAVLLFINNIV